MADTPNREPDLAGESATDAAGADAQPPESPRFYGHVVVVALASGLFALVWFMVYSALDSLFWDNELVEQYWWLPPLIIMSFSLAVGLAVRYLHAPTSMDGSLLDEMTGDPTNINWRRLPVAVLHSLTSLLAGAVVGPEGALGRFAGMVAEWYSERLRVPVALRGYLVFAAASSAYNGLLANPLFTAVLGADVARKQSSVWSALPANLLGGVIGFAIFYHLGSTGIADFFTFGSTPPLTAQDMLWAVPWGLVGMIMAIVAGVSMKAAGAAFGRLADRPVSRALVAGGILSVVSLIAPVLLFSGEHEIEEIVADSSAYGFWLLLLLAAAKLVLLAVSLKSGYLGGPTFPVIFAATCVALAANILFPDQPIVFILAGVLGGSLMALFRTPLMVILLTAFLLGAGVDVISLIVISVVTVMILLPSIESRVAAAQARRAG